MPLAALLPALLPILNEWLGKAFPDPAERDKQAQALIAQLMTADTAQIQVNTAEAQSGSNFRGGWRPAIGWVCAAALAYQFLLAPLAMWIGFVIGKPVPKMPTLDDHLWELMFAMLGMGALRSFDKLKSR